MPYCQDASLSLIGITYPWLLRPAWWHSGHPANGMDCLSRRFCRFCGHLAIECGGLKVTLVKFPSVFRVMRYDLGCGDLLCLPVMSLSTFNSTISILCAFIFSAANVIVIKMYSFNKAFLAKSDLQVRQNKQRWKHIQPLKIASWAQGGFLLCTCDSWGTWTVRSDKQM